MSGARLAALGWRPRIGLEAGIADTYRLVSRTCGAKRASAFEESQGSREGGRWRAS